MKNIVVNKKELKDMLLSLFNNGVIRILFLILLVIIAASVYSVQSRSDKKNFFGKIIYRESLIEAEPLPINTKASFSFQKGELPAVINIYSLEEQSEEQLMNLFNSISNKLLGKIAPKVISDQTSKTYYKEVGRSVFVGNLLNGSFSFSGESKTLLAGNSENEIGNRVFTFLKENGLERNLSNSPAVTNLTRIGDELETTSSSSATILSFTFRPTIEEVPLVGIGEAGSLVSLLIDKTSGKIVKIQYYNPKTNTNNFGKYELLGVNEVKKTPFSSFRVIQIIPDENGASDLDINDLARVNFTTLEIAYLVYPQKQNLLPPVYVLGGEAISSSGKRGKISVYLPAVKNSNLLNPAP
ncbi:hypothetical protein HY345_04155 [Candidatus Microgenomates bacterium]|nr:hypothetical protein [Candidatus Microgenomates bacterium]